MNTELNIDIVSLRKIIVGSFNLSELSTLCFDLGIEFENLSGDTVDAKSRELVKYCHKYGMLDKLIAECNSIRPNVQWQPQFTIVNSSKDITTDETKNTERLYALVVAFNKTMFTPKSPERTIAADDIAYSIRELAPNLTGLFDVGAWLKSYNPGKRLAAIMFLNWSQDIEFVPDLLALLPKERFFLQYYILNVVSAMMNQFDDKIRGHVIDQLSLLDSKGDTGVAFYQKHILNTLSELPRL